MAYNYFIAQRSRGLAERFYIDGVILLWKIAKCAEARFAHATHCGLLEAFAVLPRESKEADLPYIEVLNFNPNPVPHKESFYRL